MEQNKQSYTVPLVIAISVFSVSMIFLWLIHANEMNSSVAWVGASYAIVCFTFLVFQIYAFVRAHVVYDDDVENIKYRVFEIEDEETKKLRPYFK